MLAVDIPKNDELYLYSNPIKAQAKAFKYLGKKAVLYKSQNVNKKYSIILSNGANAPRRALYYLTTTTCYGCSG